MSMAPYCLKLCYSKYGFEPQSCWHQHSLELIRHQPFRLLLNPTQQESARRPPGGGGGPYDTGSEMHRTPGYQMALHLLTPVVTCPVSAPPSFLNPIILNASLPCPPVSKPLHTWALGLEYPSSWLPATIPSPLGSQTQPSRSFLRSLLPSYLPPSCIVPLSLHFFSQPRTAHLLELSA